ncbi:MAG: hypothetical protein RI981_234, partial [Bacteroidota bacterium]
EKSRGVAQAGSAPGLGPGGRRFESCLPDHFQKPQRDLGLFLLVGFSSFLETPKQLYLVKI